MSTARTESRSFLVLAALLIVGSAVLTLSWSTSMFAMPGMPWMRMPGQTWSGAAGEFLGMWIVMMMAMMLPVLAPAVPVAAGLTVMLAGALQLTRWKSRQLACCRQAGNCIRTAGLGNAWRHGIRLGLICVCCCAPLTAVLFAVGVMDLRAMALVTAAITAERLANHARVVRIIGLLLLAAGSIYLGELAIAGP